MVSDTISRAFLARLTKYRCEVWSHAAARCCERTRMCFVCNSHASISSLCLHPFMVVLLKNQRALIGNLAPALS